MNQISIFLAYSFSPDSKAYTKAEIEAVMEEACGTAKTSLSSSGNEVLLNFDCYLTEFGEPLNAQLRQKLKETDIAIVDVSDKNLNVYYELGVIHGAAKKAVLIQSEKVPLYLPSDLLGLLLLRYDPVQSIRGRLAREIEKIATEIIRERKSVNNSLVKVWTLDVDLKSNHVCVVAPPTRRRESLPDKKYPDYCYIDFLGDKDSLLEVSVQIAKVYGGTNILRYTSKEFPNQNLKSPLVIVGGPGDGTPDDGNLLCKRISDHLNLPISYSDDCEVMVVKNVGNFAGSYNIEDYLSTDYGCVIRCGNPWNPHNRILLFHGIHTYGVLGAVLALSEPSVASSNASKIVSRFGVDAFFYAFFPVEIVNGAVTPPILQESDLYPL